MSALCLTDTLSSTWHQFQVALATCLFDISSGSHQSCHPHPSTAKLISTPSTKINKLKSIPQQAPSIIAGQHIANLLSTVHKSAGECMGLAGTTYKGNQSGKSVVDSGFALYREPRRSRRVRDRGDRARQISHKTSGGQTMSPCANPNHHVIPESNHGPHNPIRYNPSCLNSTINPSYQFISFISLKHQVAQSWQCQPPWLPAVQVSQGPLNM